jgi:hypothetical protein
LKTAFKQTTKDIRDFEARLAATLKPVTPPDEFVRGLREKLLAQIQETEPEKRRSTRQLALIVSVGLLSFVLLIVASIRTIISLILSLRVVSRLWKRKPGGKKQL